MNIDEFLSALACSTKHAGATQASLARLEEALGLQLPGSYLDLMRRSSGVEGFVAEDRYLMLWPVEQIAELNEGCSVAEFAPGLLLIGSDGAEIGYAFDTRFEPMPVKRVPFVGMSHEEAKTVARTFEGFLDYLKRK